MVREELPKLSHLMFHSLGAPLAGPPEYFPGRQQPVPAFQKNKPVTQTDYLCLLVVYGKFKSFAVFSDFLKAMPQIVLIVVDQIEVIHVAAVILYP
jgi:hypothetical protein